MKPLSWHVKPIHVSARIDIKDSDMDILLGEDRADDFEELVGKLVELDGVQFIQFYQDRTSYIGIDVVYEVWSDIEFWDTINQLIYDFLTEAETQ